MRISSSTLYDVNVAALNQQQSAMLHTQQQVASGRRILTPADDPVAAARALELTQSDASVGQYAKNIDVVHNSVVLTDAALASVTSLLQDVQVIAVQAANTGAMNDTDRKGLSIDLQSRLDQLIALANSTDGVGNYLFSGFQGKISPFANTAAGVQYMGDDGQRLNQVSANRQMASSDSGADIFMRIKNGNGTFVTQAVPANTGSGGISGGSVINPAAFLPGDSYRIDFAGVPGAITYSVTNTTTGAGVVPATPYVSGQAINFDGIQLDIQGVPAAGDQFTVTPSTNESVFKTLSNLISALSTPAMGNTASMAQLNGNIGSGLNGLTKALDNVLTVRSSIGERMRELDALKSTGADLSLQYKTALSLLQDVDYNAAITDLTQKKTSLEASQKSFLQVMNMSMFNYM